MSGNPEEAVDRAGERRDSGDLSRFVIEAKAETHHRTAPVGRETGREGMLSARHRLILSHLVASGGTHSAVTLARDVAAHLAGESPDSVRPGPIRRTFVQLRPYLADLSSAGYIEYRPEDGSITLPEP